MTGRTTWYARDAAFLRRELIVELGEEHGPGGITVMDALLETAQQQRNDGDVRTGYRTLSREAFVSTDDAREIVEHAARIGALDDLVIDDDGRRFTCRISGWKSDQDRGREAIRKATQRRSGPATPDVVPENRDSDRPIRTSTPDHQPGSTPGDSEGLSRSNGTPSGSVPLPDQTRPEKEQLLSPTPGEGTPPARGGGGSNHLLALVDPVLDVLRECPRFTVNDLTTRVQVENAIRAVPADGADPVAAAHTAVVWASDPNYRKTDAGSVFLTALRHEARQNDPAPRGGGGRPSPRPSADGRVQQLLDQARAAEAEEATG